jgi:hypothetical protein
MGDKFTSTFKLRKKPRDIKTIPIICPWCNTVTHLTKWEVEDGKKTAPSHGICPKCLKELTEKE